MFVVKSVQECEAVSNTWDPITSQSQAFTPGHNTSLSASMGSRLCGSLSAQSPMVSPMRNYSSRLHTPLITSHSHSPLAQHSFSVIADRYS